MLQNILGFVLILLPFVAILRFENRLKGFLTIFSISAAFHFVVAIGTQSLHIFSYPYVVILHFIYSAVCVYFGLKNKKAASVKKTKHDWFVISLFIVIFAFLISIHYRYSGYVDTSFGAKSVLKSAYTYPFFSDEWAAVSFVNYSIENNALPFVNPLYKNTPFVNFVAGFHSLLAELFLLLGFLPLTHYVWFAIASGFITCLFVYLILRLCKVTDHVAAIAAATIPFITNAGNLPGIWYLIPYNVSTIFILLSILGFLTGSRLVMIIGAVLSLFVYPPMIVFVLPLLFAFGVSMKGKVEIKRDFILKGFAIIFTALFIAVLIGIQKFSFVELISQAVSFISRKNLSNGIILFNIFNVIPFFIIPFVLVGFYEVFKKKINFIIYPVVVGGVFWIVYLFVCAVFLIEPSRVVAITSLFLVMIGGFGIESVHNRLLKMHSHILDPMVAKSLKVIALIFFIVLALFAPRLGLWNKLVLEVPEGGTIKKHIPSPPVSRYLTEDDLRLFSGIKQKVFIAPMWKGLVVGAATGNYPLDSKASVISNRILTYNDFMMADCDKKNIYAKRYGIDFAYIKPISCPAFIQVGQSGEGLMLYKFDISLINETSKK